MQHTERVGYMDGNLSYVSMFMASLIISGSYYRQPRSHEIDPGVAFAFAQVKVLPFLTDSWKQQDDNV